MQPARDPYCLTSLMAWLNAGAKVAIACTGDNGQTWGYMEETTNWMGGYAMQFQGSPDLSRCYSRVISGPSGCGAAAGPAQGLNLMFSMFGMQMYVVDPLLSQPQQPMSFCPPSSTPSPAPRVVPPPPPPRPVLAPPPPVESHDPRPPPIPFLEATACSYE